MVLGLGSKNRKRLSFQVDYLIHVQEVKPWPQSQSLKSTQSIVVQWENGDKNFGSFTCGVGDGRIGIGESFRLSVTLYREASKKSTTPESFRKNILEFYLYESRKDRAVKGQLLGSAAINLADYGVIKETITISAQVNCKRSFKTSAQPVLYVNIQPLDRDSSGSSPNVSLSKEVSLDRGQSLSGLDSEGNDEEAEIASFTDDDDGDEDDLSSHSSRTTPSSALETTGCSPLHTDQKKSASVKDNTASVNVEILDDREKKEVRQNGEEARTFEVKKYQIQEDQVVGNLADDAKQKQVKLRNDTISFSRNSTGLQESFPKTNKLKHLKSVQFPFNSSNTSVMLSTSQLTGKRNNIPVPEAASATRSIESKATMTYFSDGKGELESKVEMLEEELREAAAVEVAVYSVVAEHGSSAIKVHAPARRLSRFYLHACKARSPANRASAARTAVSGLVLVAKACGNDVPRLTFWLSNSILLRAIVSQAVKKLQLSSLKSHKSSHYEKQKNSTVQYSGDWEDPQTFIVALENVEAWVFNRIIESVWWQTLTPHMQPAAAKSSGSRKTHGRRYGLGDQEQGNFSIDLWKKAFQDACERLCPLRAGGHECGCLTLLPKLVMEQLVCRLDVAMFNAILRESAEEMPTDPVSDPISDSKVLPIPAGKSSFGSGAQLKNAIGNWSRWLTDLFGIDDTDAYEDGNELDDDKEQECETSFKAFHLLNALSDLMMLPLDMLADRSIRKEVCPKFGASLVKRVLYNFVPDEFCPDPIPDAVLEALDSEELLEAEEDTITSFPCTAAPTVYRPPPAASLTGIIGEVGSQSMTSGSSVLRKAYTSDDELDELDSPISSIVTDNSRASPALVKPSLMLKKGGGRKVVRYQLLREVWRDG